MTYVDAVVLDEWVALRRGQTSENVIALFMELESDFSHYERPRHYRKNFIRDSSMILML
jgi:hypothetical protein